MACCMAQWQNLNQKYDIYFMSKGIIKHSIFATVDKYTQRNNLKHLTMYGCSV